mmetsp:Transcript_13368/g.25240  ORF Transcript_13368/g.25240 Transcript_13368/m.25240 type:complete len:425 (-) Transcript_13368:58-1332(-)
MSGWGRQDRERSPRGAKNSGWISRAIAGFGRYKEKRPAGLQIDSRGALKLDSLYEAWGWDQGLTKEDVLRAVSDNLYFDSHKKDEKRFEILTDSKGVVSILVHQRRGNRNGGQAPWKDNVKKEWESGDSWSEGRGVASPVRSWESDVWSSGSAWDKSSGSKQEVKEEESSWADQSKDDSWAGQSKDSQWNSWDNNSWSSNRNNGEQVQRWLGWALKSGYKQMGVPLKDGEWIWAESLAEELGKSKPKLNITSVAELQNLLDETDQAGRFEISDGYIRKVKRDDRVSRATTATAAAAARHRPEAAPERPQHADGSAYETSYSYAEKEHHAPSSWSESSTPARHNFSPPRASGSAYTANSAYAVVQKELPGNPQDGQKGKPPPPPGAGWSKFTDDGHFWWFYEGPLGKWWCQDVDKYIEPYVEEDE